jgi:hypothetical protein
MGLPSLMNVPVCTVKVYVDGELQLEVGMGQNDDEDVTVSI